MNRKDTEEVSCTIYRLSKDDDTRRNDEVKNETANDEKSEEQVVNVKKKSRLNRSLRKFFRLVLRRKILDIDDGIDEKFPTTLDVETVKEYNKEESFPVPTPNLNMSPHYVHHNEMKEEQLKYLFARRSCHLPGNSWWQDWLQFICNNHPLFGLCLHHKLHPLTLYDRISILISSISFGLIATNLVYLHFLIADKNFEEDIIRLNLEVWEGFNIQAVLTSGVATLLLFNGILHVLFDISMWHLSAATCCHHLKNHKIIKKYGSFAVVAIALIFVTLATLVLLFRLSYQVNEEENNEWMDVLKIETFFAVIGYILQLSIAYFIISPVIVTVMFSGVLGCIPFLGGRPKDIQIILDDIVDERIKYYNGECTSPEKWEEHEYYII